MNHPASTRMLKIWRAFQALPEGRTIKAKELADQLEVTTRTISRDINELKNWGLVVASNRDGLEQQGYKAVKVVCPFCNGFQPISHLHT